MHGHIVAIGGGGFPGGDTASLLDDLLLGLVEVVADRPGASGYRVSADGIEPLPARRLR